MVKPFPFPHPSAIGISHANRTIGFQKVASNGPKIGKITPLAQNQSRATMRIKLPNGNHFGNGYGLNDCGSSFASLRFKRVFDTSSGFATFSPLEAEKASVFICVHPWLIHPESRPIDSFAPLTRPSRAFGVAKFLSPLPSGSSPRAVRLRHVPSGRRG